MESKIASAIHLELEAVALIWADERPEEAMEFAPGKWGCVMFHSRRRQLPSAPHKRGVASDQKDEDGEVGMGKRRRGGISKVKAIQNALGRLGWHASSSDVVAFLAQYHIDVTEGLVYEVKRKSLKDPNREVLQQAKVRRRDRPQATARMRETPKPRSDRK